MAGPRHRRRPAPAGRPDRGAGPVGRLTPGPYARAVRAGVAARRAGLPGPDPVLDGSGAAGPEDAVREREPAHA
ncbi:hypothetical protein [Streptomyces sp. NPDC058701]|uniref:hypothetical protein n=1 Tax=Streptomyces sp. NPDC058701 TaxID=3346608 RepID=UPI0036555A7C